MTTIVETITEKTTMTKNEPWPSKRNPQPITIVEIPNGWGWHKRLDRTVYRVLIGGERWSDYCYRAMAENVADGLRKEGLGT